MIDRMSDRCCYHVDPVNPVQTLRLNHTLQKGRRHHARRTLQSTLHLTRLGSHAIVDVGVTLGFEIAS